MHTVSDVNHGRRIQAPPPPPPPPPPREKVDPAVRAPALHKGQKDAPPPEHYVQHEVQRGETLTEVSHRYQTTVPMIQAANPQIKDADQIEIGQKVNEGDTLCIIEAMKMQNILKAERDGRVKAVKAKAGDPVAADDVVDQVRLDIFPDGGLARLRLFGDLV